MSKGIGGTLKLFISFMAILVIAFFAIGFTSTVQAPTNQTALNQYNNLTQATAIAGTGLNATVILLMAAMVFSALAVFYYSIKRKR